MWKSLVVIIVVFMSLIGWQQYQIISLSNKLDAINDGSIIIISSVIELNKDMERFRLMFGEQ